MLMIAWGTAAVCQSTTIGVKIGNNGNLSFTNKYKSGNYTEMYRFGNGYQAGIDIYQPIARGLGVKAEVSYVNSNFEIDHDSYWLDENKSPEQNFYEEISINNSAFNVAGNAVIKIGRVKLGFGPELSMAFQTTGRGSRYNYNDPDYDGSPELVQYRFYSNRKQVYNLNNEDEKHAFETNRVTWGLNYNLSVVVYKPFSVELKVYQPMTYLIEDSTSFTTEEMHQMSINAQLSVVYNMPLQFNQSYGPKLKKRK
ncbi:outer membrane beta-barrel protein [Portibacter lacus]|nr:outer membrane beta-barrel protein [Portibacter lacus]